MATILGRDNMEYLQEDDGTVWNMNKTIQYDPITLMPLQAQDWNEYDIELKDEQIDRQEMEPEIIRRKRGRPRK